MSLYVSIKKTLNEFELDINLAVGKSSVGILGTSGSGKSMTLKCIAGLETPDSGLILINGKVVFSSERNINVPPQERNVGYLFQNYALFPNMTVLENITIGLKLPKQERIRIALEKIEAFGLGGLENVYPDRLSGGQQQRAALARILVKKPEILMLDEPFSALDSSLKWQLEQEAINTIDHYDATSLFVSHSRDEVYRICSNIAVVSKGKVDSFGEKKEIFENPKTVSSAKLTGCKNISKAKKIDSKTIMCVDWGINLAIDNSVLEDLNYIGIRAHFFEVAFCERTNSFEIEIRKIIEAPFTITILFNFKNNNTSIWWEINKADWEKISKESLPNYLSVSPGKVLKLKEEF